MKIKKIIASFLCVAITAGFAGCDNTKKDREAISKIIDQCEDAFKDDDFESFADLTNWDEDDKTYQVAEKLMDFDYPDDYYTECYDLIFSSIKIKYDADDIEVNGDKASVDVNYVVLDCSEVTFKVFNLYYTYKDAIENTKETETIRGKIDFRLEKGEWKISKITKLDELFSFMGIVKSPEYLPTPPVDPTETQPTVPEPTDTQPTTTEPSGTSETTAFADSYGKAMASFKTVLERNREAIQLTEAVFGINAVGFCDLDGNGLPELYFIADDGNEYSASLHIFEYKEYAGEAVEIIMSPEIITQGQASNYIIYLTDKELIVTYTYGESYSFTVCSDMFALGDREGGCEKWDLCEAYSRETFTDYDPATDTETVTKHFSHNGTQLTEDQYMTEMKDFTNRTVISLSQKFVLSSNDPEYGLMSKPSCRTFGYGLAIEYVESEMN